MFRFIAILALSLALALSSCKAPSPSPTPTPTPTPSPITTLTPTPTPSPTPSAAPSPTPASTPTPSPTAKATPAPTPVIPAGFSTYRNSMFGFQISYPPQWTLEEQEGTSPVLLSGPGGVPAVEVHLGYKAEMTTGAAVVDALVNQLGASLSASGFRLTEETQIPLSEQTLATKVSYRFRIPDGELRTSLLAVARGSQYLLLQASGLVADFEKQAENINNILLSLRLEEPQPFGIPRQQALTLYFDEGPLSLDPAIAQESRSIQYITQVFSGLVSFDSQLKLVADLAQRWEASADGKVYTFYLRENARFHDGRPVTARDIKYSWERAARPETGSPTVTTYLGDIVGVNEMAQGKANEIAGVTVVDDRTLRVTIDAPKAYFLSKLAHPVAFVVDRNNTGTGRLWWRQPNATGPFRVKDWREGVAMLLERNNNYYREPARVPYVVFRFFGGIPALMYESGEIDAASVFVDDLERITNPANPLSRELLTGSELSIFYVGFNTTKAPFNDLKVRQAFLAAVDRQQIANEVLKKAVQTASGFLPPGLPGYNPNLEPIAFNPEEARRLLAQSSYGSPQNLPPIVYTTSGFTVSPMVGALLDMWEANLGVKVQVRLMEPSIYYYQLKSGLGNLYNFGWIVDYPDPHNFLDMLFHSAAENNVGGYQNPSVDSMLEQARQEKDQSVRFATYQQVERMLIQDAAAIPLHFGRSYLLVKPYVKGMVLSPQGNIDLRLISLSSSQ